MLEKLFLTVAFCLFAISLSFGQSAKPAQTKTVKPAPKTGQPAARKPVQAKPAPGIKTVKIGDQTWAAANLNTFRFRNGDTIPEAKTAEEWKQAGLDGKPAWCYCNNDPATGAVYGRLYNWFAVSDIRGLAPEGFEVPSESDWEALKEKIGGVFNGGKLKSTGLTQWKKENKDATNETGFGALPSGYRFHFGDYTSFGENCHYWSSTMLKGGKEAYFCELAGNTGNYGWGYTSPQNGFSVRLIKKAVRTVQIGTQTWMKESLNTLHFRNGDPIMQAKTSNEWLLAGLRKIPAYILATYWTGSDIKPMVYYNWYAVNDKRGLAPEGFHIPSQAEWNSLLWLLKGADRAGEKLKSGIFAGETAGMKFESGESSAVGSDGGWWSATEFDSVKGVALYAPFSVTREAAVFPYPKGIGIPVRCIADSSVSPAGPVFGKVSDVQGREYKTVILGEQTWMAENLRASQFSDSTKIPFTAYSMGQLKSPGYVDYTLYNEYSQGKLKKFGAYYNGYVALQGNPCPKGWHVPTKEDIEKLIAFLGSDNEPRYLKASGKDVWEFTPGNDLLGFNALGAGYLEPSKGLFLGQRNNAEWWSSTEKDEKTVWTMSLGTNKLEVYQSDKTYGLPIRCLKD